MGDLKAVIFILILIWIVWFIMGGARQDPAVENPFIKPAAPIDSGKTYGPVYQEQNNPNQNSAY